jgi:hypothetical protein
MIYFIRVAVILVMVLTLNHAKVYASYPHQTLIKADRSGMLNTVETESRDEVLQFTAGSQVLGFKQNGFYLASGNFMLQASFLGATTIEPVSDDYSAGFSGAKHSVCPMQKVIYPGLWPGITLNYTTVSDGIMQSMYCIEPNARVTDIRLRYNTSVQVLADGSLQFLYANGFLSASAPIAWQEINGRKVSVPVAFKQHSEYEVGFIVGVYDSQYRLIIDPVMQWHTFWGSSDADYSTAVALDGAGNVYITGYSENGWGTPINAYSGGLEAFVAKLNSSGVLQWLTFMGSANLDVGTSIAIDNTGNIYIAGYSETTWGTPLNGHAGGMLDAFVTKLNNNGALQWNTFLGSDRLDWGLSVATDNSGGIYLAGRSVSSWGAPVNDHAGGFDAFAAKLNNNGALQWNTFLGSSDDETGFSIAVDSTNNVYVAGVSDGVWGSPVNGYNGGNDAFATKLNSSGVALWHTFLGSSGDDSGYSIAVDTAGNVYVAGYSETGWGAPVNPHAGGFDAFTVKLNSNGVLQWNTFLGGGSEDVGEAIAVSGVGDIYVSGYSESTWGAPVSSYVGGFDAFTAKLNSAGAIQWHFFSGSVFDDSADGIATDGSGNIFITGSSDAGWGTAINTHTGDWDAFVAKIIDNQSALMGDLNNDGKTDLTDLIISLQIVCNILPSASINITADANGDGKIGVAESVFILEKTAGLR